jgi:hypothetical protein
MNSTFPIYIYIYVPEERTANATVNKWQTPVAWMCMISWPKPTLNELQPQPQAVNWAGGHNERRYITELSRRESKTAKTMISMGVAFGKARN